jgi:pyruvate formate lyase activating enzyme
MTLEEVLKQRTAAAATELSEKLPDGKVRCYACGHRCPIPEGRAGVCRVRFNVGGELRVPWGYVGALQCDPVEKKPFFHAYPGALAMSFGMLGCDLHCGYCQNWVTSQALRDPVSTSMSQPTDITPQKFVELAKKHRARIVTSTYNEPLITSEWAVAIFQEARAQGLICSYVSNGNATEQVLDYIKPYVSLYKVDLKSFDDKHYRELGGQLKEVLNTIQMLQQKGFWVEIVTLIVPGFNDSDAELREMAKFLVSVSPDIPWHVTAFHPDYKMRDRDWTQARRLVSAAEIGYEAGLRYVYAGNIPGGTGRYENTFCPQCKLTVIERYGFEILANHLDDGKCPKCRTAIAGRWWPRGETPLIPEDRSIRAVRL